MVAYLYKQKKGFRGAGLAGPFVRLVAVAHRGVDEVEELGSRLLVFFEEAAQCARGGGGVDLLDAAHLHTHMARLDHDGDPFGIKRLHDRFGDLLCQLLLDLHTAGEDIDDTRYLGETHHLAVRDVGDMGPPDDRQQVVLAGRVELDILDEYHLIVGTGKGS